jgi:hypothetical protein
MRGSGQSCQGGARDVHEHTSWSISLLQRKGRRKFALFPSGFGRRRQRAPARVGPALFQVEQHGAYRSGAPRDWVIARSALRQFGELELEIGRALGIGPSGEQFHHLHLEGRDLLVRRVWIQSRQGCVGNLSPNADGTAEPSSQVLLSVRRYTVHQYR